MWAAWTHTEWTLLMERVLWTGADFLALFDCALVPLIKYTHSEKHPTYLCVHVFKHIYLMLS